MTNVHKQIKLNKHIKREGQGATKIFDNRSLANDYRTLIPVLKEGMRVLDVGCGTGAITKDIAKVIGDKGRITGKKILVRETSRG